MTKENVLFTVIGLLLGLIIGFFFANSVNQSAAVAPMAPAAGTAGAPMGNLPAGHPNVPGTGGGSSTAEVQSAIDKARQNPTDFESQMKAAEMYYQIQRYDGAVEFLKKANEIQPDNYEVIVNLGNASFDGGKYEEAEKWYTAALQKKPDNLDVRSDLGLPDHDRAVKEFKRVLESDPNHVQALQNLTVAYTKKSDKANAESTLAQLEKVEPTNSSIARLKEDISKIN
jgi:tetratricopeptide (TPR) repeat protein